MKDDGKTKLNDCQNMDFLVVCKVASLLKQALLVEKADVQLRNIEELGGIEKFRSVICFCRICNFLAGMCQMHSFRFLRDRQCLSRQASTVVNSTHLRKYLGGVVMTLTIVMIFDLLLYLFILRF